MFEFEYVHLKMKYVEEYVEYFIILDLNTGTREEIKY